MNFRKIAYLLPLALLTACGAKNGSFYTAPTGTLDSSNASTVKSSLSTAASVSFTKPSEFTSPTRSSYPSSCYTMDPTAKVDVDNDGIGLKSTYTFDCTNTASGANTYTMKGSLLEVDKDDTAGSNHAGGWRFDLDYNWTYTAMRAGNGSYTLKGFFDLTKGATNYVYASNYQMAFSGSASPDDRATYAITMGSTWNHTITPDDMALPKKSGAITFSGFWGYKVNVTTRAEANVELVLQGTSAGLTYDQSCSNHFKAGTITFTAGTGTMTMTYDCNNATVVKLNGTVI